MQEESLWDPIKMQGDRADPLSKFNKFFACQSQKEREAFLKK